MRDAQRRRTGVNGESREGGREGASSVARNINDKAKRRVAKRRAGNVKLIQSAKQVAI